MEPQSSTETAKQIIVATGQKWVRRRNENQVTGVHPSPPREPIFSNEISVSLCNNPDINAGFDGDESYDDASLWGDSDNNLNRGSELDREWKSRREQFYNHGYREGISAGKNDSAQEGFNDGFKDSVLAGYNWGHVRGITSALAYLPEQLTRKMVESEDKRREFKSLHESVCSISKESALKAFYDDMNGKKASAELVDPKSDQQSGDQISECNVLESHFQKLQLLLQSSPELEVGLEKNEKRKP